MLMPWTQWTSKAAGGAVQDKLAQAAFEFGLGFQEFEPQHLGRDRDGVMAARPDSIASSMRSFVLAACSAMERTARSRMSRSRLSMPVMLRRPRLGPGPTKREPQEGVR